MSLLTLFNQPPPASGAGDWLLDANGDLVLDENGDVKVVTADPCACCVTVLGAPVLQCSDNSPVIIGGSPALYGCAADDSSTHYFWSVGFQGCMYADCSAKSPHPPEEVGIEADFAVDGCSNPTCDADGDTNPDPLTFPPPETIDPDALDCCGNPSGKMYQVVISGVVDCTCTPGLGSQKTKFNPNPPPEVLSFEYTVDLHNAVNRLLAKAEMSLAEARDRWPAAASPSRCPA